MTTKVYASYSPKGKPHKSVRLEPGAESAKLDGLKAGATVYVRLRAYSKFGGKAYAGIQSPPVEVELE